MIEGFERERVRTNAVIISSNAKSFCLLIRQNILEAQVHRVTDEIQLYERQLGHSQQEDLTAETQYNQLKERIQLLEGQLMQTKQESDFYIKQVQDLERGLKDSKEVQQTLANEKAAHTEQNTNTINATELLQKKKVCIRYSLFVKDRRELFTSSSSSIIYIYT